MLSKEKLVELLFGPDAEGPASDFVSGADFIESVVTAAGITAEDFERHFRLREQAEADTQLADGTQLVCPNCGGEVFDEWDLTPVRYLQVKVRVEGGVRTIDDSDIFDSQIGEGGEFDDLTCRGCDTVGLALDDLVPKSELSSAEETQASAC
jgi:hypothetical protein